MSNLYDHLKRLGACRDARKLAHTSNADDVQGLFDRMPGAYFEQDILCWKLWYLIRTDQMGPQEIKELQGLLSEQQASKAADRAVAFLLREEPDEDKNDNVHPARWNAACALDDMAHGAHKEERDKLQTWLDKYFPTTVTTMWEFEDPLEEDKGGAAGVLPAELGSMRTPTYQSRPCTSA